jgi:hypothetical protein
MNRWPQLALAVALTGCIGYQRPTLRPGSNVAVSKPTTVGDVVAKAILCSTGGGADTARTAQKGCVPTSPADTAVKPAPIPARIP